MKDIVELKNNLLAKKTIALPLIFSYTSNVRDLVKSYVDAIAENNGKQIIYAQNMQEIIDGENSTFTADESIYLLFCEKDFADFEQYASLPIIFLRRDLNKLTTASNIPQIDFPQLVSWQIEDYIKAKAAGLTEESAKWLCSICNQDLSRIDNEVDKIALFPVSEQQKMLELNKKEHGYDDLSSSTIFDLVNATMKKDFVAVKNIIKDLDCIDVEGLGLITLFTKQLKNILDVKLTNPAHYGSLKLSEKQINYIRYAYSSEKVDRVLDKFYSLLSLDEELKTGNLDLKNDELVIYILGKMLAA